MYELWILQMQNLHKTAFIRDYEYSHYSVSCVCLQSAMSYLSLRLKNSLATEKRNIAYCKHPNGETLSNGAAHIFSREILMEIYKSCAV